ncbi:helix-turn-helix domain-containing protein [uncultured Fusobacterium sp.]|uniref:helix-turn-helix domain-containing protein n=2 Tax=Fusobacterium TaxID=848 RepID=UPI0025951AC7|nr:helix-turn-helix domain-containing protein [uncultured Fusobacterium sp.]
MRRLSINKSELKLLKRIQEKKSFNLEESEDVFNKSETSLKRNISNLNSYLPDEKKLKILNNTVTAEIDYRDYIEFVHNLSLNDYIISQGERINLMIVYSFFSEILNMTSLYDNLGISLTTKKKDSKELSNILESNELKSEIVAKKGIKVVGNERNYRILIASILSDVFDLDFDDSLINRKANNPLERMIFNYFIVKGAKEISKAKTMLNDFLKENNLRISYSSKKFIYIYIALSLYRINRGHSIENKTIKNMVEINEYSIMNNEFEDNFLSYLISSLDYTTRLEPIISRELKNLTEEFIEKVQNRVITQFYNYDQLFNEIYGYIHKSLIRNSFKYSFYDNNIENTKNVYANLYNIVKNSIDTIEEKYKIYFTHQQISAMTLIFRKTVMKNKVLGRNRKKIVIVSNSAIEKIDFFVEILKIYTDVEIVLKININELYLLEGKEYDLIITFSNRIKSLLEFNGYENIKLDFYLENKDIEKLFSLGVSTGSRKIKVNSFIDEIKGKSDEEIKEILLNKYEHYFLNS